MFLCERHCAPLHPCWPPVPPTSRALSPPRVLPGCHVLLFCCFFFFAVPVVALSAAPARPACAPCSSLCYPCLAALRPLTRPSPLPISVSQPTLPALFVCPPCLSRAVTRVRNPRALPLPLSVVPTLFPGASPTLVLFPRSLSLTSSWMPCVLCVCGRGVSADWTVSLPEDWHDAGCWVPTHHEPPHHPNEHRERQCDACRIPFAAFALWSLAAETSCGDSVRSYSNRTRAPSWGLDPAWSPRVHTLLHYFAVVPWSRRPPRPGAFRVGRGQTLRAGHA